MTALGRARRRRQHPAVTSTMPAPGDPARFEGCRLCRHVRLEHSDDGARCDAHPDPALLAVDDRAERCPCDRWQPRPVGGAA